MIDDDDCGDDFGNEMFTRGMESPNEEEGVILQSHQTQSKLALSLANTILCASETFRNVSEHYAAPIA